ncbi:MAG: hypothetical protein K2O71_04675, partial [Lachnospiraceae bacterium]|nr:hypothetical protein [Lachnospiraceae bacterium]
TGLCDQVNCVKTEIFAKGTVPNVKCTCHVKASVCSTSGQLASVYCPPEMTSEKVFLIKEETSPTHDTPNLLPTGEDAVTCAIHTAESILPPEPDEPQDPDHPDEDDNLDIPLPPPPGEPDIPTPSKKPTPTPTPSESGDDKPEEDEPGGDEPGEEEPGEDDYEDEWID